MLGFCFTYEKPIIRSCCTVFSSFLLARSFLLFHAMPPDSDVPTEPTARRFSQYYVPQAVYLGLDLQINTEKRCAVYAILVHDGSYTTDYYTGEINTKDTETKKEAIRDGIRRLLDVIQSYSLAQHFKVQLVACSAEIEGCLTEEDKPERTMAAAFWRQLDAIPCMVKVNGETPDERASAAVRKAVIW